MKSLRLLALLLLLGATAVPLQAQNRSSAQRERMKEQMRERIKQQKELDKKKVTPRSKLPAAKQKPGRTLSRTSGTTDTRFSVQSNAGVTTKAAARAPVSRQNAGQGEPGQVIRDLLSSLTPDQRRQAHQYAQALSQEERRALFRTVMSAPAEQRNVRLLEMAATNAKPQPMPEIGSEMSDEMAGNAAAQPPLVIGSVGEKATFSGSAIGARGKMPGAGQKGPEVVLPASDGTIFSVARAQGKPLVLEFGCLTCPVYRSKIGQMNELAVHHPQAQFVVVYTTEAHPSGAKSPYSDHEWVPQKNAKDNVLKPQSTGLKQRQEYVAELKSRFGERRVIAIDDLNDTAWKAYGAHPNSAFVIGADGVIVGSMEWSDPEKIGEMLSGSRP